LVRGPFAFTTCVLPGGLVPSLLESLGADRVGPLAYVFYREDVRCVAAVIVSVPIAFFFQNPAAPTGSCLPANFLPPFCFLLLLNPSPPFLLWCAAAARLLFDSSFCDPRNPPLSVFPCFPRTLPTFQLPPSSYPSWRVPTRKPSTTIPLPQRTLRDDLLKSNLGCFGRAKESS